MPPKKKQRTSKSSSVATQHDDPQNDQENKQQDDQQSEEQEQQSGSESPTAHKDATKSQSGKKSKPSKRKTRDTKTIPELEYIGIHRPYFDYETEARLSGKGNIWKTYKAGFEAENNAGVIFEPAKDHPEHKWSIMWEGFKMFADYKRRSHYCCPDKFDMYIYNDFEGWGFQELVENFIVEFNKSLKNDTIDGLKHMWAIVGALSLWLNTVDQGPLLGNEDGEKTTAVLGLAGFAVLRGLAALDFAGHVKPDTEFLDIPIVITCMLEFYKDMPEYGIEDTAIEWRPHAAAYFKKGKFSEESGVCGTKKLLDSTKGSSAAKLAKKADKDPWGWDKLLKEYKRSHGLSHGKIGGKRYDITLMTRQERASYAFEKKDPLADVSERDLKEGNLDFEL